jgi:BREX protein BrxB
VESLQKNFDELRQRLKRGRGMNNASDDPVFYLVFRPAQMLSVKRRMKQWIAKLNLEGWQVQTFSMAEAVHAILKNHDLRDIWLESEKDAPLDFEAVNDTLADALTAESSLKNMLDNKLQSLAGIKDTVLFVTDLEALHPYLRVGTIEQSLQGRFTVPTVILYPGVRAGRTTLRFLGIYPEDGNYRSIHIGG